MLIVPGKMVSDHFDTAVTSDLKFWIRGAAAIAATAIYAVMNLGDIAAAPAPPSLAVTSLQLFPLLLPRPTTPTHPVTHSPDDPRTTTL